ncbi:MAG: hypothetical protein Ct9H300mP13_7440 [Gammaproteobacteria bacterium]|nr:MAG: hypothetical protein Ct9H300mP13_7440 [Gammaproteobacteria bacterium]
MVYVRGHACDFDEWEERGASAGAIGIAFRISERLRTGSVAKTSTGEVMVCYPGGIGNGMQGNPLYQAFISAGEQAGYPRTDDYNGYQQEGFGGYHMTVGGGVRASSAQAYLRPILGRSNLRVVTQSQVHRIVLEGRRAVAVVYEFDGHEFQLGAQAEFIVVPGHWLASDIAEIWDWPRAHLSNMGIGLCILWKVGGRISRITWRFTCSIAVGNRSPEREIRILAAVFDWTSLVVIQRGLGATNHFEAGGFIRSKGGIRWPDIQFHFLPGAMRYDGAGGHGHGFQVHVGLNKVESRGRVQIRSSNPRDLPSIQFNYLQHHHDQSVFRRAVPGLLERF